ncbi:DVU_1555 family C-GCAxxG-C-C protein [Desulfocurvus sp. DL9XJH121]
MLDDTGLRMMRLAEKGYCCSQIMLHLALADMGRENPDLVRAMAGLCKGLGQCAGPCGVLTGGAALIALHMAKGRDDDEADDKLPLVLSEYADWFQERATGQYGGANCCDIMGGDCARPDPQRCGMLIYHGFNRIQELFAEYGVDPTLGKD